MIGKAKSIQHGINALRYIMGESKKKKHPEKICYICSRHLPPGLDAMSVWNAMQLSLEGHDRMKNSFIRIELSPSKEHTQGFTKKDWTDLWDEFMREFDHQVITDDDGTCISARTNLAGSKGIVYLHEDSIGQIPHLHGGFCRVDEDGKTNNDHRIDLRAQRAAEAVARHRGWETAMKVHIDNAECVARICEQVLKSMPSWSWYDYVSRIEHYPGKHLSIRERKDSNGDVTGYCILSGNAKYKASELCKGRKFMYSKLASTWRKLHAEAVRLRIQVSAMKPADQSTVRKTIDAPKAQPMPTTRMQAVQSARVQPEIIKVDYSSWTPDRTPMDIEVAGKNYHLYLPKDVVSYFDDAFDYREVANWQELTNLACAYFAAILTPDAQPSVAGGGTSNESSWGRKKDEDDLAFAHRCAIMAQTNISITRRGGRRR